MPLGQPRPSQRTTSNRSADCQFCFSTWLSGKAVRENAQHACGGAPQSRRARRPRDRSPGCGRRDGRFRNPPLQAMQRARQGFSRQPPTKAGPRAGPFLYKGHMRLRVSGGSILRTSRAYAGRTRGERLACPPRARRAVLRPRRCVGRVGGAGWGAGWLGGRRLGRAFRCRCRAGRSRRCGRGCRR